MLDQRRKPVDPKVNEFADEAMAFRDDFEDVKDAIWRVLDNAQIRDQRERAILFRQIMAVLKRRNKTNEVLTPEERAIVEEEKRERMLREAMAHEKRQPPDTYFPSDKK